MHSRFARPTVLLTLVALTALAPAAAFAATVTEHFETVVELDAAAAIELRNTNGNVTVTAWDRDVVEIVAEKRARAGDRDTATEALEQISIEIDQTPHRLRIETELPRSSGGVVAWLFGRDVDTSVNYELRVPRRAELEVLTVNGRVSSSGPRGEQRLRTTNGRIEVDEAGGDVDARTTNGSIEVALAGDPAPGDIEVSTTNGSITLHLPSDLHGRLEARTVNGRIRTELPITVEGSFGRRTLSGALNGGGDSRVGLRTVNGSISIFEIG